MVDSQVTSITPATHADRHVIGGADPLIAPLLSHHAQHEAGGADQISGFFQDKAIGILPALTANQWVTPVSDLDHITDGNMDNSATQNTTNVSDDVEEIVIDLGSLMSISSVIYGYSLETGGGTNLNGKIYASPDNITYTQYVSNTKTAGAQNYTGNFSPVAKIRYVKFHFEPSFSNTSHANILYLMCMG